MKIIYNSKTLANPDAAVAKSVQSWQDARKYTQIALVATVVDLYRHGDKPTAVKRINTVVEGAKGANTPAIVEWAVQMGFKVADDGKSFATAPEHDDLHKAVGEGFATAKDLHWWDLKPINPFEGYDLQAALRTLVKRANQMEKVASEDTEKAPLINIDSRLLAELEELVAA